MAFNTLALSAVISAFRLWAGGNAFDRIKREFDSAAETGLSGSERRKRVVAALRAEFPKLAEAVVLAAIQLLWLQVPEATRAQVEAIGK